MAINVSVSGSSMYVIYGNSNIATITCNFLNPTSNLSIELMEINTFYIQFKVSGH